MVIVHFKFKLSNIYKASFLIYNCLNHYITTDPLMEYSYITL